MTHALTPGGPAIETTLYGFTLTRLGLSVPAAAVPSYEQWADLGHFLRFMEGAVAWLLGDWLRLGEAHYGEIVAQAIEATDLDSATLRKYCWVCERIPPERRVAGLSFTHHQVIAALSPADQETWLTRAATGTDGTPWTVRHLKTEVETAEAGKPEVYWLIVGCLSEHDRQQFRAACEGAGRRVREL